MQIAYSFDQRDDMGFHFFAGILRILSFKDFEEGFFD